MHVNVIVRFLYIFSDESTTGESLVNPAVQVRKSRTRAPCHDITTAVSTKQTSTENKKHRVLVQLLAGHVFEMIERDLVRVLEKVYFAVGKYNRIS